MSVKTDPLVRIEVVSLALGISLNYVRHKAQRGELPPLSAQIPTPPRATKAWPLSVLAAHDPELGRRCAALLAMQAAMLPMKLKKAA